MRKVYIVTSGEHDNFGIDAVFATKELAEEYIKMRAEYPVMWIRRHYGEYDGECNEWDVDEVVSLEDFKEQVSAVFGASARVDWGSI